MVKVMPIVLIEGIHVLTDEQLFIEPSKKYADIIIPEGGHNEIGISMLTILTERYMSDRSTLD